MDNTEFTDIVTDKRGVRRSRVPPIRNYNGQWTGKSRQFCDASWNVLAQARVSRTEAKLAENCHAVIDSKEWLELTEDVISRGYLVIKRTELDFNFSIITLPADQRIVSLTASGMYFAHQTLSDLY